MGWAYGTNSDGREIGYGVPATCDQPGCEAKIHRGLAYSCGNEHGGGEHGCGEYFCYNHLTMGGPTQLCRPCLDRWVNTTCADEDCSETAGLEKCSRCGDAVCATHRYHGTDVDGEPRVKCLDCCEPPDAPE